MLVDREWNICLLSSQPWMQERGGTSVVWRAAQVCGGKPTNLSASGVSHKIMAVHLPRQEAGEGG